MRYLLLSVLVVCMIGVMVPSAFADVTVYNAPGSSTPGCEEGANECFIPNTVRIPVGGTVTWVNDDSAAHTTTSGTPSGGPDGVWDSGLMMTSALFSHTFDEIGSHDYFCAVHPWMGGTVIISTGPDWIKNNAGWWADGHISDAEFLDSMEFLISQDLILDANFSSARQSDGNIPAWVKNTAGWWADGHISDAEFVNSIKYLAQINKLGVSEYGFSSGYIGMLKTVDKNGVTVEFSTVDLKETVTSGTITDGYSGEFDTSLIMPHSTYSITFEESGTYNFFSMVHPWHIGSIEITDFDLGPMKQEQERLKQERIEQERLKQERIEQERLKQERLEQERIEQERIEREGTEQERLEQERIEQERLEQLITNWSPNYTTLTDTHMNFSIKYPMDWEIVPPPVEDDVKKYHKLVEFGVGDAELQISMYVTELISYSHFSDKHKLKKIIDLEKQFIEERGRIFGDIHHAEISSIGYGTMFNIEYEVITEFQNTIIVRYFEIHTQNGIWTVILESKMDGFCEISDNCKKIFEVMKNSFTILDKDKKMIKPEYAGGLAEMKIIRDNTKIVNPSSVQNSESYNINTECEVKYLFWEDPRQEDVIYYMLEDYAQWIQQEYFLRGGPMVEYGDREALAEYHALTGELISEVIMHEYSINPILKDVVSKQSDIETSANWIEVDMIQAGDHPCEEEFMLYSSDSSDQNYSLKKSESSSDSSDQNYSFEKSEESFYESSLTIQPLYIIIGAVAIGGVIAGVIAVTKRGSKTPKPVKQKPKPAKKEPAKKEETSAFCDNCGNSLRSTAKFCGSCGSKQ